MLYPQKNLFSVKDFDAKKVVGIGSTYMYYLTNLKPNTDYTVSTNAPFTSGNLANIYANGSITSTDGVKNGVPKTVKSSASGNLYILVRYDSENAYQKVLSGEYLIQIEEGSVATEYKPYTLGNARPSLPTDIVAQNMTGSTHKPTNGNVFSVLKDVKVKTSKINVMETGDFNVAIYEWEDGKGIVGTPLVKVDKTYSALGIYTIDFGGTLLKAGKKYWIGRYILSGQAGVMRALGYDVGKTEFVTWLGGSDYTGTSIVYPTTYYYFFSLEFERPRQRDANLVIRDNLFDGNLEIGYINPTDGLNAVNAARVRSVGYIPVNTGDVLTLSSFPSLDLTDARVIYYNSSKVRIGDYWTQGQSTTFTIPSQVAYIRFTNAKSNDLTVKYGITKKAAVLVNRPAKLSPRSNFILPFSQWYKEDAAGITYEVFTDNKVIINFQSVSQYVGLNMPVDMDIFSQLKGKTVTFSAKTIDRYATGSSQVQLRFYGGTGGNVDFVLSSGSPAFTSKKIPEDFTGVFLKIQSNVIGAAKILVEDLKLEIGATMTSYDSYKLVNPPAVLVPQKNLFDLDSLINNPIKYNVALERVTDGVRVSTTSAATYARASVNMKLKSNTQYTISGLFGVNVVTDLVTMRFLGGGVDVYYRPVDSPSKTFTTGNVTGETAFIFYVTFSTAATGYVDFTKIQLEEGSKATEYRPYILGNPKL